MTTTATTTVPVLNLDQITLGENVRKLNPEHVASLASSIKERGLLVPLNRNEHPPRQALAPHVTIRRRIGHK